MSHLVGRLVLIFALTSGVVAPALGERADEFTLLRPGDIDWITDHDPVAPPLDSVVVQHGLPSDTFFLAGEPRALWQDGVDEAIVVRPLIGGECDLDPGVTFMRWVIKNVDTDDVWESNCFGFWGGRPVVGDFDGDGIDEAGVVQGNAGEINQGRVFAIDLDGDFGPGADQTFALDENFALSSDDHVLSGDFDGDGIDDLAVWRNTAGQWFLFRTPTSGTTIDTDVTGIIFGLPGDLPLVFDYNGDGRDDLAVWRPSGVQVNTLFVRIWTPESGYLGAHEELVYSPAEVWDVAAIGTNFFRCDDFDDDGICDDLDPDDDDDGCPDASDPEPFTDPAAPNFDGDCASNAADADDDDDGCPDTSDPEPFSPLGCADWDDDCWCDDDDPDDDDDGVLDLLDPQPQGPVGCPDFDGDGGCDDFDDDDDDDGVLDVNDPQPQSPPGCDDYDGDGGCDDFDDDDDDDGVPDGVDPEPFSELGCADCNENGVCNHTDPVDCVDCDESGTDDLVEIAADPSLDCDGDLVLDWCDYGDLGVPWIGPAGGDDLFVNPDNWCPLPPTIASTVFFNQPGPTTAVVQFTPLVNALVAKQGDVSLVLDGPAAFLDVSTTLSVGDPAGDVSLMLSGGGQAAATDVEIGTAPLGAVTGTLRIMDAATLLRDVTNCNVGSNGHGVLIVEDGGALFADGNVEIGALVGSSGYVRVDGATSVLKADNNVVVRRGELELAGGLVQALDEVELFPDGVLTGVGTIDGGIDAIGGTIAPGDAGATGVIEVLGALRLRSAAEGLAGALDLDVAGDGASGFDHLTGPTNVELSGGLFVRIADGYVPPVGTRVIIDATGPVTGNFDVIYVTGLPADLAATVETGLGPGGNTVVLRIVPAPGNPAYEDPISSAVSAVPSDIVAADFDADGDEDLAVTFPTLGQVTIYFNDGVDADNWLGFDVAGAQVIPLGGAPTALVAGRWDVGSSIDLAVANPDIDVVHVLTNDGNGGLGGAPVSMPVAGRPRNLDAGPIDGDAFVDLAVVTETAEALRILANDGTGAFALAPDTAATGTAPRDVRLADFDGNGVLDAVVANAGSATVIVYEGPGVAGTPFVPRTELPVDELPILVDPVDVTGNKEIDLVVANADGGTVSVILNLGAFAFAATVNIDAGGALRSLDAIDLDGDADPDLALVATTDLGNGPENVIRLIRNDTQAGQLSLSLSETILAQGEAPQLVLGVDVDADGDADLVSIGAVSGAGPGGGASIDVRLAVACVTDLNGDGQIGFADLLVVLGQWGPCAPPCEADIDGNGAVDFTDLITVLSEWGSC